MRILVTILTGLATAILLPAAGLGVGICIFTLACIYEEPRSFFSVVDPSALLEVATTYWHLAVSVAALPGLLLGSIIGWLSFQKISGGALYGIVAVAGALLVGCVTAWDSSNTDVIVGNSIIAMPASMITAWIVRSILRLRFDRQVSVAS